MSFVGLPRYPRGYVHPKPPRCTFEGPMHQVGCLILGEGRRRVFVVLGKPRWHMNHSYRIYPVVDLAAGKVTKLYERQDKYNLLWRLA